MAAVGTMSASEVVFPKSKSESSHIATNNLKLRSAGAVDDCIGTDGGSNMLETSPSYEGEPQLSGVPSSLLSRRKHSNLSPLRVRIDSRTPPRTRSTVSSPTTGGAATSAAGQATLRPGTASGHASPSPLRSPRKSPRLVPARSVPSNSSLSIPPVSSPRTIPFAHSSKVTSASTSSASLEASSIGRNSAVDGSFPACKSPRSSLPSSTSLRSPKSALSSAALHFPASASHNALLSPRIRNKDANEGASQPPVVELARPQTSSGNRARLQHLSPPSPRMVGSFSSSLRNMQYSATPSGLASPTTSSQSSDRVHPAFLLHGGLPRSPAKTRPSTSSGRDPGQSMSAGLTGSSAAAALRSRLSPLSGTNLQSPVSSPRTSVNDLASRLRAPHAPSPASKLSGGVVAAASPSSHVFPSPTSILDSQTSSASSLSSLSSPAPPSFRHAYTPTAETTATASTPAGSSSSSHSSTGVSHYGEHSPLPSLSRPPMSPRLPLEMKLGAFPGSPHSLSASPAASKSFSGLSAAHQPGSFAERALGLPRVQSEASAAPSAAYAGASPLSGRTSRSSAGRAVGLSELEGSSTTFGRSSESESGPLLSSNLSSSFRPQTSHNHRRALPRQPSAPLSPPHDTSQGPPSQQFPLSSQPYSVQKSPSCDAYAAPVPKSPSSKGPSTPVSPERYIAAAGASTFGGKHLEPMARKYGGSLRKIKAEHEEGPSSGPIKLSGGGSHRRTGSADLSAFSDSEGSGRKAGSGLRVPRKSKLSSTADAAKQSQLPLAGYNLPGSNLAQLLKRQPAPATSAAGAAVRRGGGQDSTRARIANSMGSMDLREAGGWSEDIALLPPAGSTSAEAFGGAIGGKAAASSAVGAASLGGGGGGAGGAVAGAAGTGGGGGGTSHHPSRLSRRNKPSSFSGDVNAALGNMQGLHPTDFVLKKPYSEIKEKYVLHSKTLGHGQFGVIRPCMELATGKVFACKSITKKYIKSREDAEDIRKEVACLNLMKNHPTIVSLKDTFEDTLEIHIVMELCLGGDLFDRVSQRGRLSEESASKMCRSLVEALLHCHLSGIMHRDIKPENILLCDRTCDFDIKLVDFGVATFFDPGERIKEVLGTPEYMAPEVLLQSYGPEADIWSAGVVLYIALCGVPPFWAASRRSVVAAILEKDVSFKSTKWAGISDDCKDLVSRMLTKDPHRRITALEILDHPWIRAYK